MSARARLFVAVIPPASVLDLLETVPREPQPHVRYTTRDQWHVTLRFLGDVDVDEATAALQRVDARSVEAVLGPSVERLGRTIAMVPVAPLDQIAAAVRRATAEVCHPIDERPFFGHLTIARMKNARRCPATGFAFSARFTVGEVHLVRSILSSDGARYEVVATRALTSA